MKILIALFLAAMPAAAQAYGMPGGWHAGGAGGAGCGHAAVALYAVLAALGYWVLQHAMKEEGKLVRKTGSVLGMTLVVVGLLGLLCGVGAHAKKSMGRHCGCQGQSMMQHGCPEAVGETSTPEGDKSAVVSKKSQK